MTREKLPWVASKHPPQLSPTIPTPALEGEKEDPYNPFVEIPSLQRILRVFAESSYIVSLHIFI